MKRNKLVLLNKKELVEITGGRDVGSWLMKRIADAYQYFFCNHNNGYYFDSHPEHTHNY